MRFASLPLLVVIMCALSMQPVSAQQTCTDYTLYGDGSGTVGERHLYALNPNDTIQLRDRTRTSIRLAVVRTADSTNLVALQTLDATFTVTETRTYNVEFWDSSGYNQNVEYLGYRLCRVVIEPTMTPTTTRTTTPTTTATPMTTPIATVAMDFSDISSTGEEILAATFASGEGASPLQYLILSFGGMVVGFFMIRWLAKLIWRND